MTDEQINTVARAVDRIGICVTLCIVAAIAVRVWMGAV